MDIDGSHDGTGERRLDARALRFALIFPALLSLALAAGGLMLGRQLPEGIMLPLGSEKVPLAVFLAVGALGILVLGAGVGFLGARTALPRMLRRIVLGAAMTLQLSCFTLFAAALLGQGGNGALPPERVDGYVMLMGTGLACAMGVVLALTFKPEEQWTSADDQALARLMEDEEDPSAANDAMAYFIHPRGSVTMMILLVALLPGSLLALISPWILLGMVVAALLAIVLLSATVEIDRQALTVKVLGLVPVMSTPCEDVAAAVSLDIAAGDYGGVGLRRHSGSASFLARSGAAVVLRENNGGKVVVGAPNLDLADELSAILNRRAGKPPHRR